MGDGNLVNSQEFDGINNREAIEEITKLAHTPCEIKFILYKNKSLAKTLRESYKKHLK